MVSRDSFSKIGSGLWFWTFVQGLSKKMQNALTYKVPQTARRKDLLLFLNMQLLLNIWPMLDQIISGSVLPPRESSNGSIKNSNDMLLRYSKSRLYLDEVGSGTSQCLGLFSSDAQSYLWLLCSWCFGLFRVHWMVHRTSGVLSCHCQVVVITEISSYQLWTGWLATLANHCHNICTCN